MQFTSTVIEKAVESLSSFPGIGQRTALRLVIYLLKRPDFEVAGMADALLKLKTHVNFCDTCGTVSDHSRCSVCASPSRNQKLICVVEDFTDMMALESTGQFHGVYHILGGLIKPIDGIGPDDLRIGALLERISAEKPEEIIMAFSATIEGDTTMFYLTKKLREYDMKITCISRGISVGGELEYADELTLGRSLLNRTEYKI